ncbi:MAG: sulfatase [Verrucomicrobiales bacterium]
MKALLSVLLVLALPASAARQPHIIIFLVDDMGLMDSSVPFLTDAEGRPRSHPLNEFYHTPHLARLAERGLRFSQFYAMSVCSPSRISLLTGQNPARHHSTNWINPSRDNAGEFGPPDWNWRGLGKDSLTLPRLLQQNGYHTIHIGKAHFGPRGSEGAEPLNLGFDQNIAGTANGQPGSYYGTRNYGKGASAVPHLEAYHGTETFLTEALTREAKTALSQAAGGEKPIFLHFAHYAVHTPFQSDPRFAGRYRDSGKSKQAQAFATLIEGMDKSLGDLLDHLDELGIAEDTLIFFLGDNGGDAPLGGPHEIACAAPLRGKKGSHYEGGMRIPFLAAWARPQPENPLQQRLPITPKATQRQVGKITDLFPTILQLTGIPAPEEHVIDGHPLQSLLQGKPDPARPETFLMPYPHGPHRSHYFTVWRSGDWKLIHHALPAHSPKSQSDGRNYQLFNLAKDPSESHDLAEEEPAIVARLIAEMEAQLSAHQALRPRIDEAQKAE